MLKFYIKIGNLEIKTKRRYDNMNKKVRGLRKNQLRTQKKR